VRGSRHPLIWAKRETTCRRPAITYIGAMRGYSCPSSIAVNDRPSLLAGGWPMNVDLARIQFAFTSINHFFFVPITIGLAFLTALLETAWYRTKLEEYLRLTRFFGTLLVINMRA
jgi:Cytochrome bd terminal oxidase subunit I